MQETVNVPTEIVLPDLDRDGVATRSDGIPYIEYEAYGTYILDLVQFRAEPGNKNNPHFRADCIVVKTDCEAYAPGREVSLHFPTGRQGTASDPGKKERDDERVSRFVCAVFRKPFSEVKAKTFSATQGAAQLLKAGKIPVEKRGRMLFQFTRTPGKTEKRYDKKTDQLKETTYPNDKFDVAPR